MRKHFCTCASSMLMADPETCKRVFFRLPAPCSLTSSCASSCACRCHLVPLASLLFAEALVRATQLALCVLVLQGSLSQLGEQAGPEKGLCSSEVAQGVQALHVHVLARDASVDVAGAPVGLRDAGADVVLLAARVGAAVLLARVGAKVLLDAPVGVAVLLDAPVGEVVLLDAGAGAAVLLDARVGAVLLDAPVGEVVLLDAQVGAVLLDARVGAAVLLDAPVGEAVCCGPPGCSGWRGGPP